MTEPVITTQSLTKELGGRPVVHDISVQVMPGEVVGILGKNGAGKSTLLDLLLGFSLPTSGRSSVFGHNSASLPPAAKARIGFVPQEDELVGLLTGAQQLALIASLHSRWDAELAQRLAREWQLPLERRISTLSGGERQKLSTLLALGYAPPLLVLDEPAASLDPVARRQFMQEILGIAASQERTILYATHIVADLERVANRIWILRDGLLAWQGDLDALKETVVRLHLRASHELSLPMPLPHQLSVRRHGNTLTVAVSHFDPDQLAPLAASLDAQIEVEALGLEEIFLELHA
jgi:ABC-2 type transport system ATP-binding protein